MVATMARVDTVDLISISEANSMGVDRFEQWQQLEDDLIDITLVAARMLTTSGPSISLDEVLESFGYTREELEGLPD